MLQEVDLLQIHQYISVLLKGWKTACMLTMELLHKPFPIGDLLAPEVEDAVGRGQPKQGLLCFNPNTTISTKVLMFLRRQAVR